MGATSGRVRLGEGEYVLREEVPSAFWTGGQYFVTLGMWAIWRSRHRFYVTNERVIATQGVVTRSERSVPLSRVQDVDLTASVLAGGFVRLSSAGGGLGVQRLGPFTRRRAREVADQLSEMIRSHRGDGLSVPTSAPAATPLMVSEELERLAALRERGVVSDEEFEAQKAKLLA